MINKIFNKIFNKDKKLITLNDKKAIYESWATTKTASGFLSVIERLPNPDVVLRYAGKNISVLRTLENHYQVGACIESRKAGTLSFDYSLNEKSCNKERLSFYQEIFNNIDIYKLIEDILDTPLYGYNPIEINWEKAGNYIIPISLIAKPQEWFYFNSDGDFFFKDRTQDGKRQIDLNSVKFLLPRYRASYLNPYGKALLSRCFWNVAFIQGGMEFWVRFAEKYAMPYIFGKYNRSMTNAEKDQFLQALVNMVQDAAAVIPSDGSVEIMQAGTSANSDIYSKLITKCENNISKAILGQTLSTDIGSSGSYAASKSHMEIRSDIVESDKKLVENTINHFIRMINFINFNDNNFPVWNFKDSEDLGLEKAQRDNQIALLGVEFSEEYILRTYGYQKGDIKIIPKQNNNDSNFEAHNDENFQEQIINPVQLSNPISPQLNKIIDFFDKTRDSDEALEKLEKLYPKLNFEELEEILTKIIFISELKGRTDVKK